MNELPPLFLLLWKKRRGVPEDCLFSHVLSVRINLRPTSGKKTGKQQGCHWGPQNKPETPVLPKRTLSSNMFLLPVLLQCLPALPHLLLVIGVQGHIFYDLWWQCSMSLVCSQEAVGSFDEAFAFTFSAKVWWFAAGMPPSNVSYNIKHSSATKVLTLKLNFIKILF